MKAPQSWPEPRSPRRHWKCQAGCSGRVCFEGRGIPVEIVSAGRGLNAIRTRNCFSCGAPFEMDGPCVPDDAVMVHTPPVADEARA